MKVAFLGDFACFKWGMLRDGWKKRLEIIAKELRKYDLVVANLEAPITYNKTTYICKGIHLKTSPQIIDLIKYLNIGVVCLANNHIYDYGASGLSQTIEYLDANGIKYYGVNGKSEYIHYDGNDIAFHGYCCYSTNGAKYITTKGRIGVNALVAKSVEFDLKTDKEKHFFSILSFHWGDEYSPYPNERQVSFVHTLAYNYNFVVQGHHAHVIQGIEKINDSLIAYNQGNFYFDECRSEVRKDTIIKQGKANKESFILSVDLKDNRITDWRTVGIMFDDDGIFLNECNLATISNEIANCNTPEYKQKSLELIREQKHNNLVKRDIKWFLGKFNYYSIGANIKYFYYKRKYKNSY